MKWQLFFLLVLFLTYELISSLNCLKYKNDYEILDALPFKIIINPEESCFNKTCAYTNSNKSVYIFNICNEPFIPSTIFCLQSLNYVYITQSSFCQNNDDICQLPSEIGLLENSLESLIISFTKVTSLPTSFGLLKKLKTLELSNTNLTTLPNTFGKLNSLKEFSIYNSRLTSLPKVVSTVQSLTNLDLITNNYLRSIQSLNGHPNLSRIRTYDCPITRIPINLPNLSLLSINNGSLTNINGIETLGINAPFGLVLSLDDNQIRNLPIEIGLAKQLGGIGMKNNLLKNLPSNIYNLTSLSYLNLRQNRFTTKKIQEIIAEFKITNPTILLDV